MGMLFELFKGEIGKRWISSAFRQNMASNILLRGVH